MVEKKSLQT